MPRSSQGSRARAIGGADTHAGPDSGSGSVQACKPACLLDKSAFSIRADCVSRTLRKVDVMPISLVLARLHASEGGVGLAAGVSGSR